LVTLNAAHLDGAVALSAEAGWNQVLADWRMMLAEGKGIGYADEDGTLIASAIDLPYDGTFGWISMVLVTENWRRMGIATRLLRACINELESGGRTPVLDATPAGVQVYEPLGFLAQFGLTRWQGVIDSPPANSSKTRTLGSNDLTAILKMDAEMFGGGRPSIIKALVSRGPELCRILPHDQGFVLARNGRNATQIGPLVAKNEDGAKILLNDALSAARGPCFIDALDNNPEISQYLVQRGFLKQRRFTRMAKNHATAFGDPAMCYAAAGPELG